MQIQTFSIVIGSAACDAKCPHCISKQTGLVTNNTPKINLTNFNKAIKFAELSGTSTVLFTGKGEPTLFPKEIKKYLDCLIECNFPFIELQTNGIQISKLANKEKSVLTSEDLDTWYSYGLNTIAISIYGLDCETNSSIYGAQTYPLETTIKYLRSFGFTVRLCLMLIKDCVDNVNKLKEVIKFCHDNDVAELTVRNIRNYDKSKSSEASNFVSKRELNGFDQAEIKSWVRRNGVFQYSLVHGKEVYSVNFEGVDGQNVCITDCLTVGNSSQQEIRTLIFYSNGRLDTDWRPGCTKLSGSSSYE